MKFMITWQIHTGKIEEALTTFAKVSPEQDQALLGKDVKSLGRWHDLARGRGVMVVESNSLEALSNYAMKWNHFMDLDISPVLDDDETRALVKR